MATVGAQLTKDFVETAASKAGYIPVEIPGIPSGFAYRRQGGAIDMMLDLGTLIAFKANGFSNDRDAVSYVPVIVECGAPQAVIDATERHARMQLADLYNKKN